MPKQTPRTKQAKRAAVTDVMHEFKAHRLHARAGQQVTNPKQAVAIALSEAGLSQPKAPRKKARRKPDRPPDVVVGARR